VVSTQSTWGQSVVSHLCQSHLVLKTIMQIQVIFTVIFLISGILTKSFLVEVDDKKLQNYKEGLTKPYGNIAPKPYGAKGGDDYFIQDIINTISGLFGRRK